MILSLLTQIITRRTKTRDDSKEDLTQHVLAAQQGNQAAFHTLHTHFAPMVHAIALGRAPASDADDLTQEAFLRAWQRLPSCKDPARFGPWLASLTRNLITDHMRKQRPTLVPVPPDLQAAHRPSVEAAQALRHLQSLPDAYRDILIMRLVEGMTGPEIAKQTGLTPGSVRVNLHRGMALLRQHLNPEATS